MFLRSTNDLIWGLLFTALLTVGCVTDIRSRRIPNSLVVAILGSGIVFSVISRPLLDGVLFSLAGLAVGFTLWILFYALGVIGAGDVKFFAAASAWLGPATTWRAALVAAVAGGLLAAFVLIREKRLGVTLRHVAMFAQNVAVPAPEFPEGLRRRRQLPYGVALALGALTMAWFPRLLL